MEKKFRKSELKKRRLIIIISMAAIVVIGAVSLILILSNAKKTDSSDNTSSASSESVIVSTQVTSFSQTEAQTTTVSETTHPQTETTTVETAKETTIKEETTEEETQPYPEPSEEPTYIQGVLIANKTYPLPASYNPGGLLPEAKSAFNIMAEDAANEGIYLEIVSGFRSYEYQKGLYERYAAKDGYEAADRYSARPGHSEHQTGLGMDINSTDQSFAYTAEGRWLAANCSRYGFIIRYPEGKEAQTGYMYEPWHIRYLGVDLAQAVTNSGLCLEEYLGITSRYQ